MTERVGVPSWQALLKALVIAVLLASALDVAVNFWRTPLGWTPLSAITLFAVKAVLLFVVASAVGFIAGLPFGRFLARHRKFDGLARIVFGAALGAFAAISASALGNSYEFMRGAGFWHGFAVDLVAGALVGFFWWWFETRRPDVDEASIGG